MDLISSRYRKPKGRPTKRRKMLAENSKKRWQKSSKTVDEKNSNSMRACCFGNVFICAQHAKNGPKNICQMHAQLIREKQRGEEKMLEMSRQAAREAHVKVDASLKNQEIIDVSVSYDSTWQKRGHTSNL
ncbi:hypothetical protein TNCV_50181 [Trichonephila clavipes]|nr:hypothetical protein TNCV_50181 [Trichonephila clavipes]